MHIHCDAVHGALHSAAHSVAHALALVGGHRETGIILEGFQCLLILGRGPAKGVALEQLILDTFLNGFVYEIACSGMGAISGKSAPAAGQSYVHIEYNAVHSALHSAAHSVAHALALVGGHREMGIILEGFQCLLILERGLAKGVALEELISAAFLKDFL